jgi:putative transposase
MSRKYKFRDNDKLYFVTFAVIGWIDLFIRAEYKDILLKSFQYCIDNKGLELYAYCIMTSHVHLIIGSNKEPMGNNMRDMKRHTCETLRKVIESNPTESRKAMPACRQAGMLQQMKETGTANSNNGDFQLWQQNNKPMELRTEERIHETLKYIHRNSVTAGFVEKEEDWLYSSARDYYGWKGLIDLQLIETRLTVIG